MDYRYETKDEARDFHKSRKAFIIYNNKLEFIPENSDMSHFEYCQTKNISKEVFNEITRGYYIDGKVVFYKNHFTYDEFVIEEGIKFINEIANKINQREFEIYFGHIVEANFALDFDYGRYIDGKIIKK